AANHLHHVTLRCLPAGLHNRPKEIPETVRAAVQEARGDFDDILIGYADCGTGGELDTVLTEEGLQRLPGAHCYAFYSGVTAFERRAEEDMRAFFLTDFLTRQFDTLVIEGLYRYVRNPMYVSVLTFLLGESLFFQSRNLLVYAACVWVGFFLFVLGYEEPALRRKFGDSYRDYCRRVPRWIPQMPRRSN
ncbi:MAG: DUF1638 domain-containing protein, partial [Proteobacteria bacterium]|nr:DUF1638 domain-containing protein [Pseudomonadota bacterium]